MKQSEIKNFLSTTESYTLTKDVKEKRAFNSTISWHKGDLVQADLIDVSRLSEFNANYRYILCTIDCYSKMLYVELLYNKSCQSVVEGLEKIFLRMDSIPRVLSTDAGGEFKCKLVTQLIKKYKMRHFIAVSDYKASTVERVQLSLQKRLYRYLLSKESYVYYLSLIHI